MEAKNSRPVRTTKSACALSVVVPFHADPKAPHLLPRLDDLCSGFPKRSDIEFIVVDASPAQLAQRSCREICHRHKVRYLCRHNTEPLFSPGQARNFGARHANGAIITFLDVDLRFDDGFWQTLLKHCEAADINRAKRACSWVPVLYLAPRDSKKFRAANKQANGVSILRKLWLEGRLKSSSHFGPGSSVLVINRLYFLSTGGNNFHFWGHTGEDTELNLRLMREETNLPKKYKARPRMSGIHHKSQYHHLRQRTLAVMARNETSGLSLIHLWHPVLPQYIGKALENLRAERDISKHFNDTGRHPLPLIDHTATDRVLFVGQDAHHRLRDLIPILGQTASTDEFVDFAELRSFIKKKAHNLGGLLRKTLRKTAERMPQTPHQDHAPQKGDVAEKLGFGGIRK